MYPLLETPDKVVLKLVPVSDLQIQNVEKFDTDWRFVPGFWLCPFKALAMA